MKVYQLQKMENGIPVSNDKEYQKTIARYAWDRTIIVPKILDNFVVKVREGDETSDIKVICGPNCGALYKNIDNRMLVKPSLLPCFMKDAIAWQEAVDIIKSGHFPARLEMVCENALLNKKEKICAGLNQNKTRDSILSVKVLEEVLTPYLGSLGLALVLKELKRRIFDGKKA